MCWNLHFAPCLRRASPGIEPYVCPKGYPTVTTVLEGIIPLVTAALEDLVGYYPPVTTTLMVIIPLVNAAL